jgi:hypothetical protein
VIDVGDLVEDLGSPEDLDQDSYLNGELPAVQSLHSEEPDAECFPVTHPCKRVSTGLLLRLPFPCPHPRPPTPTV